MRSSLSTLLVSPASEALPYFLASWTLTTSGPVPPQMLLEKILRRRVIEVCESRARPDPSRWQTTPEAPFQALRSEEARAALACCNLVSSMVDSQDERGRPAYACSVGDTAI